ncbi:MAG: hypothetical protein K0Q74_1400, partial [Gammaproteobacteria bacterium]|nr:hypothetical protein [Gammaproteobacteria bacterium]
HQKISRSQDKLIAVFFFPDRENAFGLREVEIFFNIIQENIREMLIGAFEYEKFREILLKLTEGKDYLTYKDASGKSQQYRIFDDLITIVQRGPRYILLLDSLIKILERLKNKYPGEENNIELEKIKELQASIKNELDALNLAIEIINIPVFTEKKMAEKESHMQKMLPEVISKAIMLALLCEFRLNYSSLYTIFSDEKAYFEDFQKNIGRCENIQTLVAFLHKVIAETPSENLAEVAQVLLHKRQALEIQCMLLASPLENRRTELLNLIKKFPGYAEAINCFATLLKSRDFEAFKQAKKQYLETLPPEIAEIINICDARFTQEEAENILAKKAMQKIYALEEANAEMIQANAALERARKKLEEVKRAEEKNHTEELEQFSREIITAANKSPEFAMELGFFATCVKTRNLEGYRKARDEYLLTLSEAAPELAQMVTKGCGLLKPLQTKVAVLKKRRQKQKK